MKKRKTFEIPKQVVIEWMEPEDWETCLNWASLIWNKAAGDKLMRQAKKEKNRLVVKYKLVPR